MGFFVDWDSITSVNRAQNWCFWIGIVFFFLVLVFEMASHIFTTRKDGLVDIRDVNSTNEAKDKDQRYQQKMAELTLEIANAKKDAAESKQRAAEADERAATANERAARLEYPYIPRRLSAEGRKIVVAALSKYKGQRFRVMIALENIEGRELARDISSVLTDGCGWVGADGIPMGVVPSIVMTPGVSFQRNPLDWSKETPDEQKKNEAPANDAMKAFEKAGIAMTSDLGNNEEGNIADFDPKIMPRNAITIQIGAKPVPRFDGSQPSK